MCPDRNDHIQQLKASVVTFYRGLKEICPIFSGTPCSVNSLNYHSFSENSAHELSIQIKDQSVSMYRPTCGKCGWENKQTICMMVLFPLVQN